MDSRPPSPFAAPPPSEPPVAPWSDPPAPLSPSPVPPASARGEWLKGRAALCAVAALALVGGSVGGWLAGTEASGGSITSSTVAVQRVSATFSRGSLDVAQVTAKTEPSVVSIVSTIAGAGYVDRWNQAPDGSGQGDTETAAGSGVIVTADGQVLTNAHVVAGATSIAVTASSGKTYVATVLGSDTAGDLALLQLKGASGLVPATLGHSSDLAVGDDVVAIGNALALEGGPTVTRGIVSALNRSIAGESGTLSGLVQTDAAISSGNSGGPLVDAHGDVVGINSAVATSSSNVAASNIGFSISIDTVRAELSKLRQGA